MDPDRGGDISPGFPPRGGALYEPSDVHRALFISAMNINQPYIREALERLARVAQVHYSDDRAVGMCNGDLAGALVPLDALDTTALTEKFERLLVAQTALRRLGALEREGVRDGLRLNSGLGGLGLQLRALAVRELEALDIEDGDGLFDALVHLDYEGPMYAWQNALVVVLVQVQVCLERVGWQRGGAVGELGRLPWNLSHFRAEDPVHGALLVVQRVLASLFLGVDGRKYVKRWWGRLLNPPRRMRIRQLIVDAFNVANGELVCLVAVGTRPGFIAGQCMRATAFQIADVVKFKKNLVIDSRLG